MEDISDNIWTFIALNFEHLNFEGQTSHPASYKDSITVGFGLMNHKIQIILACLCQTNELGDLIFAQVVEYV